MMKTMMIIIMRRRTAKMFIIKDQSYARISSTSHLPLIFISTTNITTFFYTMTIKIRNKP